MERLIVEAAHNVMGAVSDKLIQLIISVSDSGTGKPVTKLTSDNFKITNFPWTWIYDFKVAVSERSWDGQDEKALSGVYDVSFSVINPPAQGGPMYKQIYSMGLQVQSGGAYGQTIVTHK